MPDEQQEELIRMDMPVHINEILKILKDEYGTNTMRDALEIFFNRHNRVLLERGYTIAEAKGHKVDRLPPPERAQ